MATAIRERSSATTVDLIPIDRIYPAKDNPRRDVGDVAELAASIKAMGILEPLIVSREPQAVMSTKTGPVTLREAGYGLIAGARRLAAAKLAGLKEVPCIVRQDLANSSRLEAMLIENLQREDLAPIEEGRAYQQLLDLGCSQHKLAERIGRSQSHISKRLTLLQLPDVAIKAMDSGGITVQDALVLTKLAPYPKRLEKAVRDAGNWGWGGVERAVRDHLNDQAVDERRAAARAKLQAAGVKLLKEEPHYSWYSRKEKPLAGQGEYESITITREKHEAEPCHAAVIDQLGKVTYVCTRPDNHPGLKKTSPLGRLSPSEKAQRSKRLAEAKAKRQAEDARTIVMKSLLKRVPRSAADFILRALVETTRSDLASIACELLGLQATRGKYYGPEVLRKYARKGDAELWRAGLAIAFGVAEAHLRTGYAYGQTKERLREHLEFLKAAGHQLSSVEKQAIR